MWAIKIDEKHNRLCQNYNPLSFQTRFKKVGKHAEGTCLINRTKHHKDSAILQMVLTYREVRLFSDAEVSGMANHRFK